MLKFQAGVSKGNVEAGYTFNDPFHLGKVDPNYTSSRVVKNYKATSADTTSFTMQWKPVIEGTITVKVTAEGVTKTYVDTAGTEAGKGSLTEVEEGDSITRRTVMVQPVADAASLHDVRLEGVDSKVETVVLKANGEAKTATAANAIDYATGVITWDGVTIKNTNDVEVAYSY